MNERKTVFIRKNKIYLDTSMTQGAFSKTRYSLKLNEAGVLAQLKGEKWCFEPWSFTGSCIMDLQEPVSSGSYHQTETVLLEGNAFEGFTLKELFESEKSESEKNETEKNQSEYEAKRVLACKAAGVVCTVLEQSMEENVSIPLNGAGGIFISNDFTKVLILPQELFETSAKCRGDEIYSQENGLYVYRNLQGNASIRFTQAVVAYRAITGEFPFSKMNSDKRLEDYIDHNFVRLTDSVYGLNQRLAFFVDNALLRNPKVVTHRKASIADKRSLNEKITYSIKNDIAEGKNLEEQKAALRAGLRFPLKELFAELGLDEKGNVYDDGKLHPAVRKAEISLQQFSERMMKVQSEFQKKLKVKRWIREHRTPLTIALCAVLAVGFFTATTLYGNRTNPTTLGLDARETVEMFYTGVNNLEVTTAQSASKGKSTEKVVDIVSNFYITTKSRSAYEQAAKCVPPASWLCWSNNGFYTVFGLSQFKIDGEPASITFNAPLKNNHKPVYTDNNGLLPQDGEQKHFTVTYYLLYTEEDILLNVLEYTDEVTVTWKKKRWIVTDIIQNHSDDQIIFTEFKENYLYEWDKCEKDACAAATKFTDKYKWINTQEEIKAAKQKIVKEAMELSLELNF